MAFLSHNKKEIRAKIVYYGPGLSGKTSNVEYIFKKMRSDHRGDLINLSTKERTLFFDFLPVELGSIKGYRTSFHIFTVPGQVFYNETRRSVLQDVDGIVFVADSQKKMRDENERSLKNLEENLSHYGQKLDDVPHVFQYNKRDMSDIMSVEELHLLLNKTGAPFFEAVATDGTGVLNTLKLISKIVLKKLAGTSSSITESEEAFVEENYGLSNEYVALNPGEHAPANVKAVTAMEFGVVLDDSEAADAQDAIEAAEPVDEVIEEAPPVEGAAEVAEPVDDVIEEAPSLEEPYEADIAGEPVDESEIPVPPAGGEWEPPGEHEQETEEPRIVKSVDDIELVGTDQVPGDEAGIDIPVDEPGEETAKVDEPMEFAETAETVEEAEAAEPAEVAVPAEAVGVVEEAREAAPPESLPVDDAVETPSPPAPPPQVPPQAPNPSGVDTPPKEIKLYQWGFPERIDVNTIRIPIFFRDEENSDEYWSYITIGLEHIYKRH